MSREAWALIKRNKNYNVNVYRRGLSVLIFSLLLSCIIGFLIFYLYLHRPERDYYATSGILPPIMLQALSEPNLSSTPLLPADPPLDDGLRVIPQ